MQDLELKEVDVTLPNILAAIIKHYGEFEDIEREDGTIERQLKITLEESANNPGMLCLVIPLDLLAGITANPQRIKVFKPEAGDDCLRVVIAPQPKPSSIITLDKLPH